MNEMAIFEIIVHAGNAKAEAFEALRMAREGDFSKAEQQLSKAAEETALGHKAQTDIIQQQAGEEKPEMPPLLAHAMDLLMTAITEKDLIENMVAMQKTIRDLTDKVEARR